MQQGQTYIPIVRFPDPNYGIKNDKFIINSPYLSWAPRRFLFASLRGLYLVHAWWSNSSLYYAKTKEITMDFKNKVNNNTLSQIPMSLQKEHHFEILITPMWPGFSGGHKNNIHFIKR